AVGAEQVIYIKVLEFRDLVDRYNPQVQPQAVCHIRVIDVVNHLRLFPDPTTDEQAYPVLVVLQSITAESQRSRAMRNRVAELLAMRLGEETAKLFYEYNASKIGTNLDGG
ncbi:MAG: hypothetical protein O7G85_14895, partial [Planctomycetota bacterium]|nr:hypothetical protein [Planctomycetota bacterium]